MPRIDHHLWYTRWIELEDSTQEYVINSLIDVEKTYEVNQDNEYLEEIGVACEHLLLLENGLCITVDRVRFEGGELHVEFNDWERFGPYDEAFFRKPENKKWRIQTGDRRWKYQK